MFVREADRRLLLQAFYFVASGLLLFLGLRSAAQAWWPETASGIRWFWFSLMGHVYFSVVLVRSLPTNRRKGEDEVLPSLGLANALTLLRAILMSAVVGFLFSPRPIGVAAWLPGIFYTAASLPDYIDGIIARKTNHVTGLGEILDMNVDSVGVFTATFLAFQYGVMPWWYVPIGLARYLFVGALYLRERAGRPVHDMPYSHRRRGFAALKMGFMFVMLFPLFGPPGTYVAAAAFGLPFLVGFLWDWFQVSGAISPERSASIRALWKRLSRPIPYLLRLTCVMLAIPYISRHLADPALQTLGWAEAIMTLLLALGILPRAAGIAAVILVGVNQNLAPLSLDQYFLAVAYIWTIFAGTGAYSLWPMEDRLIFNRIGDPS